VHHWRYLHDRQDGSAGGAVMWRMMAPLLESVLKAALDVPECRVWLGPAREEYLGMLRAELDQLCEREGW